MLYFIVVPESLIIILKTLQRYPLKQALKITSRVFLFEVIFCLVRLFPESSLKRFLGQGVPHKCIRGRASGAKVRAQRLSMFDSKPESDTCPCAPALRLLFQSGQIIILVDVWDIFYFFLLGEGEGGV